MLPPFLDPCQPTRVTIAPSGSMWVHEIKHDGYRLMVRRTADAVRIRTRRGYDWTDRFPLILEAARRLRATSFVLDGEGVILRPDGVSDFDRLHSRRHDGAVQLLGFDLLELDGADLRGEPLIHRKAALARLLRRSHDCIQFVEHIEAASGAIVFEHARKLGLEGIVSKRRGAPYQHGRCRAWLKIKNPDSPAMQRVRVEGVVLMTADRGALFEIRIDGVVRTHRVVRETAIEAARSLQIRNPGATVAVTDLRDGSAVPFERER